MASDTAVVPTQLAYNVASAAPANATVNTSDVDLLVPVTSDKMLLLLTDVSGGSNVTIQKGDGPLSSQGDLTIALTTGQTKAIVLESARFKWTGAGGDVASDKGYIRIEADADAYVVAYILP